MSNSSESKSPRPLPEIQQEYQRLCVQLGNLQYQVWAFNKEIDSLNLQLRDLNLEGAAAAKAAQEAAKVAAVVDLPKGDSSNV